MWKPWKDSCQFADCIAFEGNLQSSFSLLSILKFVWVVHRKCQENVWWFENCVFRKFLKVFRRKNCLKKSSAHKLFQNIINLEDRCFFGFLF